MMKAGINFRLVVAAVVLISAATFSVGFVSITFAKQLLLGRFQERMDFLAKYISLNSEVWVLVGEKDPLKRLARSLLTEDDVVGVRILDKSGAVLVNESTKRPGPVSVIRRPVFFRGRKGIPFLFSPDVLMAPGQVNLKKIGEIEIRYTTRSILETIRKIGWRLMGLSGLLAALAIFIFSMISRSVVLPVRELVDVSKQVAEGDMRVRAVPGKLPETMELAMSFNAMLDSLAKSREALAKAERDMMRQSFLAEMGRFSLMVAHEVKNPLSIIKSSIDILKEKLRPSGDQETLFQYIDDEISRLDRLIENFLVFARPVRPKFEEVDLNELLKEGLKRCELGIEAGPYVDKEIPGLPCMGIGDIDLLTRAIGNILTNACDAAGTHGRVWVRASCQEQFWVVKIEDDGPGIPKDAFDKIFEPFFTTKSKGSGLGLAFSAQVIKAHGGRITAENRPEGGARFTIYLEREKGEEKNKMTSHKEGIDGKYIGS